MHQQLLRRGASILSSSGTSEEEEEEEGEMEKGLINHLFFLCLVIQTGFFSMIGFVVRDELEGLWMRLCGLQASLEELAYMYAFLAVAGKTSLISEEFRGTNPDLISSIKEPKSYFRHAAMAAYLLELSMERQMRLPPRLNKYTNSTLANTSPLNVIFYLPYDWRDFSRCPYMLLRCCTLCLLLSFYNFEFRHKESTRHCRKIVEAARLFNLFALVKVADQEGIGIDPLGTYDEKAWNEPSIRFVCGLRRLLYEVVFLAHHSTFPQMIPLLLHADEIEVKEDNLRYGAKDLSIPKELSMINTMRMTRACTMSFAVKRLVEVEAEYSSEKDTTKTTARTIKLDERHKNMEIPQQANMEEDEEKDDDDAPRSLLLRIKAFLKLDREVHGVLAEQSSHYVQTLEPPNWRKSPINNANDSVISLTLLHHKFLFNRIRFELMTRLVGTRTYAPALQAIAMEHALDTLSLLDKL